MLCRVRQPSRFSKFAGRLRVQTMTAKVGELLALNPAGMWKRLSLSTSCLVTHQISRPGQPYLAPFARVSSPASADLQTRCRTLLGSEGTIVDGQGYKSG